MIGITWKQRLISHRRLLVVAFLAVAIAASALILSMRAEAAPDCDGAGNANCAPGEASCDPSCVPVSNSAKGTPPLDIFNKGGKAKWLYYGNIRLQTKNGKKWWDYSLNPDTGKYVLWGDTSDTCDGTINDQLEIVDQAGRSILTRKTVQKDKSAQSADCTNIRTTISPVSIGMPDRKGALFYRVTDVPAEKKLVHIWNDGKNDKTVGVFKEEQAFGGWSEVYTNRETGNDTTCPDAIARFGDDWVFFPMTTWDWAKGKHSYIEEAKSRAYANLLAGGDTLFDKCRTMGAKIINDYRTGTIDGKDIEQEIKHRFLLRDASGTGLGGDQGNPITLCGNWGKRQLNYFQNLPEYVDKNPYDIITKAAYDHFDQVRAEHAFKYEDGSAKFKDGHYVVTYCKRTDASGGVWGYHSFTANYFNKYRTGSTSAYRLPVLSEQGVSLFVWDGPGDDDINDDGYKTDAGVARITQNEISGADPVNAQDPTDSGDPTPDPAEQGTTCEVEGIGWIVCPVMNFMAKINDAALSFLGDNFLNISPGLLQDQSARVAWNSFRDIANILFVVLFLFIIYSQMTGAGISNYGIKRMLPKLIAAAILVNASYILCQIAIDLSNIVGANISQFFGRQLPTGVSADSGEAYTGLGDLSWGKTTLAVLAIAATAIVALALLFALGLPVLLVLAMIVLILIARKALIILLVVTSPVAFLAYLLPNTENIFKKWWGLFKAMLLLYPIIGMVFGASLLAATIINNAAGGDVLIQLTALAVTALPLFAVPLLLKGAMAGTGAIGAKLAGGLDRSTGMAGKGAKDRLKRRAENLEARAAGSNNRLLRAAGGYRNRRGFKRKEMEHDTARRQEEALAGHIDRHPGRYTAQQRAAAAAALDKRYEEEVKGAGSSLQLRMSHDQILAAAERGRDHEGNQLNEHERDAAIRYAMERGNFSERQAIATGAGTMTRSQRKSLASGMRAKGDTEVYGNAGIAALEQTDVEGATGMSADDATIALQEGVVNKINNGELSVETITKDHRVAGFVAGAALGADATARGTLQADITRYQTDNPQAWAKLDTATRTHTSSI